MIKKKGILFNILSVFIIILHTFPIYIAFTSSFKEKTDMSSKWIMPSQLVFDNYKYVLEDNLFLESILNTIFITVFASVITIIIGSMTGYVLARITDKITNLMLLLTMGVMMVPSVSLIVPLYNVMMNLGLINTFTGIILLLSTQFLPISIIMYTNFVKNIPLELDEAAAIDGCSKVVTFYKIILPQLGPVTASLIIMNGVKMFNEFLYALYFLQSPEKKMITTYISTFFNENSNLNLASAAALLSIIPIVLVYLFLQKYFVSTNIDGAVK